MSVITLIIAPPPTPNGDLHVGHMSGPYLAADIFKRYIRQRAKPAVYAVSTDDNQSYVDTTARRLKTDGESLSARSRAEIRESLSTYNIGLDLYGSQDPDYPAYITDFFVKLYERGFVEVAEVDVFFDRKSHTYPVEAFVSGICPNCMDTTCGGICEACGHPNACIDLLDVGNPDLEVRREKRLIFQLERFRPELEQHLLGMKTHRPALKRLVNSLLSRPLAPFVLSYKTARGISAGFAGLPDQQLNVWGEMYPGHSYFLTKAAGKVSSADEYIQFLGFDNSYFYVFVHVALAIAAQKCGFDWPLPQAFITNQFYNLDSYKFSTSKGHLIWARDLAKDYNTDVIRLFLASQGPEFQEANFSLGAFREVSAGLTHKVNALVDAFNGARTSDGAGGGDGAVLGEVVSMVSAELPMEAYSSSTLARLTMNGISRVKASLEKGNRSLVPFVPSLLSMMLDPFCPLYARMIRNRFKLTGTTWNDLVECAVSHDLPKLMVTK